MLRAPLRNRGSGSAREALSRFDLLRFIYVQKDQSGGGARKAKAERGQHDTPVEAVREPIGTWNASPPSTATSMDIVIVSRDAFVLHPGRNERVE